MGGVVSAFTAILGQALTPTALAGAAVTSAVGSIIASGVNSDTGHAALDPLHLIWKGPQTNGNPTPTITAAAFAGLPATAQAELVQQGVHIV